MKKVWITDTTGNGRPVMCDKFEPYYINGDATLFAFWSGNRIVAFANIAYVVTVVEE